MKTIMVAQRTLTKTPDDLWQLDSTKSELQTPLQISDFVLIT